MDVPGHATGGPGELVVVDLPPEEAWLEIVADLWWRGVAFLPLDHRLTLREKRALVDLARPTAVLGEREETAFPGAPVSEGIGLVIATSGTGGAPRLVELSRRAVQEAIQASSVALGADDRTPWIACLTPAHVGGLLVLLRGSLLGVPVMVHESFDPTRVASSALGGAFVSLVPTMVHGLVRSGLSLEGLRMLVGGGSLDPDVAASARARGAEVVTTYGLTETCGGIAYDGNLLTGTAARIDEHGGIELRGPTLMEGYRHDPGATGAALTLDGWLRTGDLGAIDGRGRLEVHGRADELIRTGAEKVWPEEVERALADHPKVRDVAVAGRPHPEWGEQVVAFVMPATLDDPPTLEELRDHAAERIPRHRAPREVVLVHEIPRTGSGKVRRSALPQNVT